MNKTDEAILQALKINMGYQAGEAVAVAGQLWNDRFDPLYKPAFERSLRLGETMAEVFRRAGVSTGWVTYVPEEARNGADATPELYEKAGRPDILFMPTAFSLTHTPFRRSLTEKGVRIASMPNFTLEMFSEGGPMSVDYRELDRRTREVAEKLRAGRFVQISGPGTSMVVEVDTDHIHVSSGLLTRPGAWGNLPGAEAYAPPVHEGRSHGYFTVPAGWGGTRPLPFPFTFHVERGRFTRIDGPSEEARRYMEENIHPLIWGANDFDVLAELGIGTNPSLNRDYILRHGWSTLVAEKIGGSAHFANGNSKSMGGVNEVPVHIDWVVDQVEITYDFRPA